MEYSDLFKYKAIIYKISEDIIFSNKNKENKLNGIISVTSLKHYCCVIFNPRGYQVNDQFHSNYIYYQDGIKLL